MRVAKGTKCYFLLFAVFFLSMLGTTKVVYAEHDIHVQPEVPTTPAEQAPEVHNGWNETKTSFYIEGEKVKGIQTIEEKLYYFDKKGDLYQKTGKQKIGGKNYFFQEDYTLATGVVKIGKKAYYYQKKTGERFEKKGIRKVDGVYYNFSSDDSLKSGWCKDSKKKKNYFDKETYEAYTGWHYVGKYKFYFQKDGQLSKDVRKVLSQKAQSGNNILIKVNKAACCVTVYAKDGDKGYTIPVVSFICSPGYDTPTGTFRTRDRLRWHELMGPCWGQWCEHLTDEILFHSVFYNEKNNNHSLSVSAYNKLGSLASHGCVRLTAGDAKWIYDHCKADRSSGTKVIIYNDKQHPGPFGKPKAKKLSAGHTWDPTDPNMKNLCKSRKCH